LTATREVARGSTESTFLATLGMTSRKASCGPSAGEVELGMAARKSHTPNWGQAPWKILVRAKTRDLPKRVNFAVVGGGFAGLTTAAWLKKIAPKESVLLLEVERLGNGASGRTGGMALAQTAAGDLPGLGDVLKGYRKILRELGVTADLEMPGVWEIARSTKSMEGKPVRPLKNSPIDWDDSGRVRAVGKVAGGTVDPGKVVNGLARAAMKRNAQIAEEAEVFQIDLGHPVRLHVRWKWKGRSENSAGVISTNRAHRKRIVTAEKVLLATNAGGLDLAGGTFGGWDSAEPKLTFALATEPLTKKQATAMGMGSGRPFYSVDLPYLWGRRLKNGGMIFGSGLVPGFGESLRGKANGRGKKLWSGLEGFDVRRGEAAERLRSLEKRVRQLHPTLNRLKITHRWGGPILITEDFVPVFRQHPKNKKVIVLGGFSGHGVALSVYLGKWAAEAMLGRRVLPRWDGTTV
jgi:glycine/D-amino acid oxidase-like deaminating enzyme